MPLAFLSPMSRLKGSVWGTGGGVYRVALEDGRVVEASLRGRLKRRRGARDRVVIGDVVVVEEAEGGVFTVEDVDARTRQIVRTGPGGRRPKVVAANVDRLVAVISVREPEPHLEVIDRLLVIAEANGLEAVLVVNKVDLAGSGEATLALTLLYRGIGYTVLRVSARTGEGVQELQALLCHGASALVGPSGAGKSSLLNAVEPTLGLRTGELSRKLLRGRHTTVGSRILALSCGGLVADTPGFGDVGVWGVEPAALDRCFPEFEEHRGLCRFQDCAHLSEPECAVHRAVDEGAIPGSRYDSYVVLMEEAAATRPGG